MVLGLVTHGRDRSRSPDRPTEEAVGLTEEDLHRIRSVAETPRHRRTPEMLCPDEPVEPGGHDPATE